VWSTGAVREAGAPLEVLIPEAAQRVPISYP